MRRYLLYAAAVLLALPASVAVAEEPLAWKLKEHDRFYAEITIKGSYRGTKDGQPLAVEGVETHVLRVDVVACLPDGGFLVEVCPESDRFSNVELVDPTINLQSAVLGVRLDAKMNIEYITGLEEADRRLSTAAEARQHKRDLEDAFKGSLALIFVPMPNKPTTKGEQWRFAMTFHHGDEEVHDETTCTDEGDELLDGRSVRHLRQEWTWHFPDGSPLRLKQEECQGVVLFDPQTGRQVQAEYKSYRVVENTSPKAEKEGGREIERRLETRVRLLDHNPLLPPPPVVAPRAAGKPIGNSIDMQFVAVPRGKFLMGSRDDEAGRTYQEMQHEVEIKEPFYIGVHTVTVGQFRQFIEATGYRTTVETNGLGGEGWDSSRGIQRNPSYTWKNPGYPQTERHPVVIVSWDDARAFCAWLSKKEERVYRLPTEAEWEYACRADSTTRFHFGDDEKRLVQYGNVADAQLKAKAPNLPSFDADDGHAFPAPVGSYRPNAWGLYDMHGNVAQWCEDTFAISLGNETMPTPLRPDPAMKTTRGGDWTKLPDRCRAAARQHMLKDFPNVVVGFRVVCENPKP